MQISWQTLYDEIYACEKCRLCGQIHNKVPGQGDIHADLMFIGEGPGADEDLQGLAFVGAAGQLLTKMIAAMGYTREQVYICNIVKCRPPRNRTPEPDEAAACLPYLRQQVALVRPKVIVLLGATAARTLLRPDFRITREHGVWVERKGVWFMPTYHPAALLRDESKKREAWHDLQLVMGKMKELEVSEDGGHEGV
ncbi:MAG: uracil-DNA glycosylase [Clostridia bacterium]|nr:uracil-DNA glycosylase [Clostridia bacterium]